MTSLVIPIYAVYAAVSVGLTVWLARTLFRNGQVFLDDVYEDRPGMAEAVNKLLVVGFYLLNLGYAGLLLQSSRPYEAVTAVEILVRKLGVLLVSLGVIHFVNMYVFHRIRQRAHLAILPPPVMPQVLDADSASPATSQRR